MIMVISGGIKAIEAAKLQLTSDKPSVLPASYKAKDKDEKWLAKIDEIKFAAENPNEKTILLDTRSEEEYAEGLFQIGSF